MGNGRGQGTLIAQDKMKKESFKRSMLNDKKKKTPGKVRKKHTLREKSGKKKKKRKPTSTQRGGFVTCAHRKIPFMEKKKSKHLSNGRKGQKSESFCTGKT